MYKIDIYDMVWKKIEDRTLDQTIFNDENINESLIHEYVLMQLSNARQCNAHTKTRWEVKSSWRKLYRQKWTGRARVWDSASPIRRWWWVAFWPRNTVNYTKSMPKKMKRKALCGALTVAVKEWRIICLNKYSNEEIKTKKAFDVLSKLKIESEKILLIVNPDDIIAKKSFRNISNVKYISSDYINVTDLLSHKKILFLSNALDNVEKKLSK